MKGESVTPNLTQLKALTHPVRVRMLGMLRIDGPATATSLATRLGLNTGATSYHLRQLAQHGFITDDPERGNARERWWKATHSVTNIKKDSLPDDTEGRETVDAALQSVVAYYTEMLQQAMAERPLLPDEWREASTFSDHVARLTSKQAEAAMKRALELINDVDDDPDGEAFVFQLQAFPMPGHVAVDPGDAQ